MSKPLVAVVGRANVGKSTFFNKVVGKKLSIVEDIPGVTRDRLYADAEWSGVAFTIVDTGGIELNNNDEIAVNIKKQAQAAVETCDDIIFILDLKTGITADDEAVADYLRKSGKRVLVAVNKADKPNMPEFFDFYMLGFENTFAISSVSGDGIADLLDELIAGFKVRVTPSAENDNILNVAVIGRPNAGKSSLVNKILGYERSIVSPIAGTTRDTIDTTVEIGGKMYNIIDTAGIRRKRSVEEGVEYYSVIRALGAVKRADVCIIVIDSEAGLSEQDIRLCGYADELGRPSVIVMNKWDLIEKDTFTVNKFEEELQSQLKFMDYFKSIYVSAKTGKRVDKIFNLVDYVYEKSGFRVSTGMLNDIMLQATATTEPPSFKGRKLKIYYATQADIHPPRFVLFVNDINLLHFSYKRYLENSLRAALSLDGTPIRIHFRSRSEDKE